MPSIQLTIPKNDLTRNQKAQLIEQLTKSISDFYLTERDENVEEFINIQIHETADGGYAVGGDIIS